MPENIHTVVPSLIPTFVLVPSMEVLVESTSQEVFNSRSQQVVVQMRNQTIHIQFQQVATLACLVTSLRLEEYREILKHALQTTLSAFGSVLANSFPYSNGVVFWARFVTAF